jgi:hypothetical protein
MVVAVLFLAGGGVAYAAGGGSLLLGKSNHATKTTKLSSGKTPLSLSVKGGRAPLAVNSSGKVARLNVDKLDGLDSKSFVKTTAPTGHVRAQGVFMDVNADGVMDALFAAATCPAGTRLTGGGIVNAASFDTVIDTASDDNTTWLAATPADPAADTVDDLVVTAMCFSPKGSMPGLSFYTTKKSQIPPNLVTAVARAAAKR